MLTYLLSRSKSIAGLFFDQERHKEPEARPKCPLCRGYRIVVFKERLDNETAMIAGPTLGVY